MGSNRTSSNPKVWIREVEFSDGTKVTLKPDDIVVLVGPNNSGKSVALMNIGEKATSKDAKTVVLTSLELESEGDEASLFEWLEHNFRKNFANPSNPTYAGLGADIAESSARNWWTNYRNGLHDLAKFFIYRLTTEARLGAASPARAIKITTAPLIHPIHYMQRDDTIEEKVSTYFREAFGKDLIVHRNAGSEVPLYCGISPEPEGNENRASTSFLKKLEELPTLLTQGDGMRSFVGFLLHSFVVDHSVVMIDEPEAFLHPPQARLLGQLIIKEVPHDRQLFLATHSGDFLRGLLDIPSDRIQILRIQRDGNVNPVKTLDSGGIRKVWTDPILRYSNVLDGIFHDKVVLCESDGDCRFYAAIMDAINDPSGDARREHTMFIHCGGKGRMPIVVESLRKLDVPVHVIADFDVINSKSPLKEIVVTLGGSWEEIEDNWQLVQKSIEDKKPELNTTEVAQEINNILKPITEKTFPEDAKKMIQEILRRSSPWSTAKSIGKTYIPNGASTNAFDKMHSELTALGLFVVPIGEMEQFCKSIGGHGPKWVNAVLEKDLANDPELKEARDFVRSVLNSKSITES